MNTNVNVNANTTVNKRHRTDISDGFWIEWNYDKLNTMHDIQVSGGSEGGGV